MPDGKNSLKSAIWGLKSKSYELGTTGQETPKKGVRGENGATNIRSFFTGIPCHYAYMWMVIQLDWSTEIYGLDVNYDSVFNNEKLNGEYKFWGEESLGKYARQTGKPWEMEEG